MTPRFRVTSGLGAAPAAPWLGRAAHVAGLCPFVPCWGRSPGLERARPALCPELRPLSPLSLKEETGQEQGICRPGLPCVSFCRPLPLQPRGWRN